MKRIKNLLFEASIGRDQPQERSRYLDDDQERAGSTGVLKFSWRIRPGWSASVGR
jgi:hypothetical protein